MNNMKTIKVELTENELCLLANDVIAKMNNLLEICKTEQEFLTHGYYSREKLKRKLKKILADEFLLKKEREIEHHLKAEIEMSKLRLDIADRNPFFNGVDVGHKKSVILRKKHILFCEHLLSLIEKEREN